MTTPLEAEQLIYQRFLSEWGTTTPVALEEEQLPSGVSPGEDPWAYVYVQDIGTPQQTMGKPGNRRFLRKAQVNINIYVPQGKGTSLALDLAQQARDVFEGIRLSPLKNFSKADLVRVGPKPPEYQISVLCPFEYTETK
ncbi:MAG: hypothetical protein ACR2QF_06200 [Geminicoccaceae bacterium]